MINKIIKSLDKLNPLYDGDAYAHCDIPCGIYDPRDAIQAAQTVVRMTELMEELDVSGGPSPSLGKVGIGLAYLDGVEVGDEVEIVVNPRRNLPAIVVRPPFI